MEHVESAPAFVAAPVTARPTPPLVDGPPLIGNALAMATDPNGFFLDCYRRHGPIFRIRLPGRVCTVLAGPEANKFMTGEGRTWLRSREFWDGLRDEFEVQKLLINTDGELHSRLRKIMKAGFARSSVQHRCQEMVAITDGVLARDWLPGETVPVVHAMQRMAADQLGLLCLSRAPGDDVEALRRFIKGVLEVRVVRSRPGFFLWDPRYRAARARAFALGNELVAHFRDPAHRPHAPTLVRDILDAADEDPDLFIGNELSMAIIGPYFAGLDTVANTTAAMVYAVLKHPEVHQRVLAEVDALFAAGPLSAEALGRLPTLHGAVMETLRMYPIAISAMRNATCDFQFNGYQVKEGDPLFIGVTVSHRMEEFYPEPQRFDVDRYGPDRREHRKPGAFAPFSLGEHTCLGAGLAEVQMMATMATLFHRLDLRLTPDDYTLKLKLSPTPGPEMAFKVRVAGRRHVGGAHA